MTQLALVTGGSRNIGEGIARRLRADGFAVIIASRTPPEHGDFDEYIETDLAEPEQAARDIADAIGTRAVTRLVHNAAIANTDLAANVSIAEMERLYAVNTFSLVALAQMVIPGMVRERIGRIVAIGSRAALGKARRVAYAGSKSALSGIIRTMALELGGDGITVNSVAPGPIETSLFRESNPPGSRDYQNLTSGMPVGFVGLPEDVAHAVSFLVSDGARYVTGQTLYVCGGASIGFVDKRSDEAGHRFSKDLPQFV